MKKIVRSFEPMEPIVRLKELVGQKVLLLCANYFYTGKLAGYGDDWVLLEDPAIVYETGPWTAPAYTDVQPLGCKECYVQRSFIEAFLAAK